MVAAEGGGHHNFVFVIRMREADGSTDNACQYVETKRQEDIDALWAASEKLTGLVYRSNAQ